MQTLTDESCSGYINRRNNRLQKNKYYQNKQEQNSVGKLNPKCVYI